MKTPRRPVPIWKREIPLDPEGNRLCSCGCGQRPVKPRKNWFSAACVNRVRDQDPALNRSKAWDRDGGVCARCGMNAEQERQRYCAELEKLRRRGKGIYDWRGHRMQEDDPLAAELVRRRKRQGWPQPERSWWECHHVVALVDGGHLTDLSNLMTLCYPCHKKETASLVTRLAQERRPLRVKRIG